jgi:hypothetical protein
MSEDGRDELTDFEPCVHGDGIDRNVRQFFEVFGKGPRDETRRSWHILFPYFVLSDGEEARCRSFLVLVR